MKFTRNTALGRIRKIKGFSWFFQKNHDFFEFSLQLIDIPNVLRVSGLVLSIKTLTMDGISGFCQRDSPGKVSSRPREPPDARGEEEIRSKSMIPLSLPIASKGEISWFFEFSLRLIAIPDALGVSGLVLSIKTLTMDGISGFCQRDSPGKVSSRPREHPDAWRRGNSIQIHDSPLASL